MSDKKEYKELIQTVRNRYSTSRCLESYAKHAEKGLVPPEKAMVQRFMSSPAKVLDIGCGAGREAVELAELGFKVTGIDITPELLNLAKNLAEKRSMNIDYQLCDGTTLAFGESSFDYVLMIGQMIHHVPGQDNRLRLYTEAVRVLNESGQIILTYNDYDIAKDHKPWGGDLPPDPKAADIAAEYDSLEPGDEFVNEKYGPGEEDEAYGYFHRFTQDEIESEIEKAGLVIQKKDSFHTIAGGAPDEFWKPTKILVIGKHS